MGDYNMAKEYMQKIKEDGPVVAICYDFDKTLTPDDMQAQGFIQSVGYDVSDFWECTVKSNYGTMLGLFYILSVTIFATFL